MEIDFGGIAKGYTSAAVMKIFKDCGVTSGLVSLGGNVQALGSKVDGSSWTWQFKILTARKTILECLI